VFTAADTYPGCTYHFWMNAYICLPASQSSPFNVGLFEFESLDGDRESRSVQPVVITNPDGYSNTLNAFMDHAWDGFYTSQKRL
jgi:hypothetical protein